MRLTIVLVCVMVASILVLAVSLTRFVISNDALVLQMQNDAKARVAYDALWQARIKALEQGKVGQNAILP